MYGFNLCKVHMLEYLNDCISASSFLNVVLLSVITALCVPFVKCSVSVHITHFWCTVWEVFYFCGQFTFLMPNDVIFLCNRITLSVARGFVLLGLLRCNMHVMKSVPVPAETYRRKFVSL